MATKEGESRSLTAGEIIMARMLFQSSINYSKVKVHNEKYMPMQPSDTAMTPNGEIYWPKGHFKEDDSAESIGYQWWFMHEMVHVWQYQLGCSVKLRGLMSWAVSYEYDLDKGKTLSDYGMEPQGNLLADYFILLKYGDSYAHEIADPKYRYKTGLRPKYEAILKSFLANPSDKSNLP